MMQAVVETTTTELLGSTHSLKVLANFNSALNEDLLAMIRRNSESQTSTGMMTSSAERLASSQHS